MARKGLFISFEGIGGTGKSSASRAVAEKLQERLPGDLLFTREPGGTPHAEYLRNLLRGGFPGLEGQTLDPMAVALLFNVARQDHVAKVIQPTVEAGGVVITDRFCDTTFAYQHVYNGLPLKKLRALHDTAIGLYPDVTFLLDCPAEVAADRISEGEKVADMFDSATLHMQERMRQTYLELSLEEPVRYVVINANRPHDEVIADIGQRVNSLIDVWRA